MSRLVKRCCKAAAIILCVCGPLTAAPVFATNYGSGRYGSCTYNGCGITVTSSGNVAVGVAPASGGRCTIQKDVVSVETVNSAGFTLTLAGTATNSNLASGANTIAANAATQASPHSLGANTWGYRVDGVGGFGAGPTSARSNAAIDSTTFAGVPNSSQPADVIAATSTAASPPVNTNIWYGVCADASIAPGTYTAQVLYTAVVN